LAKYSEYETAAAMLSYDGEFKWQGFTLEQWRADIQTRMNKIQITAKRKELEDMEKQLNNLISPERRREMELEALTKKLKG
jgi:hypothetical protein